MNTVQEKADQLRIALRRREQLQETMQSVFREFELARLDMEIIALECEVRSAVAKRVVLFLNAWHGCGRFTAINDNGVRRECKPTITGNEVQDFWNVRGEAHKLANWSFGINSPTLL